MKLSPRQVSDFWRKWSAIIDAHHWDRTEAESQRRALLQRAGFTSLTHVDKRAGFDAVLAELGALRDNLARAQEADDPTIGEARRLRHIIRTEILPCLALYMSEPFAPTYSANLVAAGMPAAEAYLQTVITGLARWNTTDRPTRPPTLDDLDARPIISGRHESPSQLAQALMTLNARLHTKRREAGHSLHDMKKLAGLPCHCRICTRIMVPMTVTPPAAEPVEANCPF